MAGYSNRIALKLKLAMDSVRSGVSAVTVADRGSPSMREISPK